MNWTDHKKEFRKLVGELEELLYNKGVEYANSADALANFKRGTDLGLRPEQKLGVYLEKHWAAITYYIAKGEIKSTEKIEGRINDAINYLFLLRCLIKDKEAEEAAKSPVIKELERLNKKVEKERYK
jgi:hypothetical protein